MIVTLLDPGVVIEVAKVLRRDRLFAGAAGGNAIARLHHPKANERAMRVVLGRGVNLSRARHALRAMRLAREEAERDARLAALE